MSTITVIQVHNVSTAEARERLAPFREMLAKYSVSLVWQGDNAAIKGTGVSGDVAVTRQDVTVNVKLGFLARAAGVNPEKLKNTITKRLAEAFEGATGA